MASRRGEKELKKQKEEEIKCTKEVRAQKAAMKEAKQREKEALQQAKNKAERS